MTRDERITRNRDASARTEDPETIQAEIQRTRAELDETVDAIQERLRPERLKSEAQQAVREATKRRANQMAEEAKYRADSMRSRMMETMKQNPIPTMLTGIGIGWLLMESRSTTPEPRYERRYRYGEYGHEYDRGQGRMQERTHEAQQRVDEMTDEARARMQERARETQRRVQETTREAQERVDQMTDEARERVDEFTDRAQERARRTQSQFQRTLQENPLAVGALALAVGTAVGLVLPETEQEHRLMGETRDRVVDRAEDMAQDTMRRAQHVARETAEAAKETAKEEAKKEQEQMKQEMQQQQQQQQRGQS